MRKLLFLAVAVALAGCGDDPKSAGPVAADPPAGASPPLVEIFDQSNELLGGGPEAFEERLAKLKGTPIVVNKWASWCGPCREEFPYFQSQAKKRGGKIAFLGVNSGDNDDSAKKFLADYPVPFPSYVDGEVTIAKVFEGALAWPTTAFYDKQGKLANVHQGFYKDEKALAEDIEKYAQ